MSYEVKFKTAFGDRCEALPKDQGRRLTDKEAEVIGKQLEETIALKKKVDTIAPAESDEGAEADKDAVSKRTAPDFVEVEIRSYPKHAEGEGSVADKIVKSDGTISGSHMSWGPKGAFPSGFSKGHVSNEDMETLLALVKKVQKDAAPSKPTLSKNDNRWVLIRFRSGGQVIRTTEGANKFDSATVQTIWDLVYKHNVGPW